MIAVEHDPRFDAQHTRMLRGVPPKDYAHLAFTLVWPLADEDYIPKYKAALEAAFRHLRDPDSSTEKRLNHAFGVAYIAAERRERTDLERLRKLRYQSTPRSKEGCAARFAGTESATIRAARAETEKFEGNFHSRRCLIAAVERAISAARKGKDCPIEKLLQVMSYIIWSFIHSRPPHLREETVEEIQNWFKSVIEKKIEEIH